MHCNHFKQYLLDASLNYSKKQSSFSNDIIACSTTATSIKKLFLLTQLLLYEKALTNARSHVYLISANCQMTAFCLYLFN